MTAAPRPHHLRSIDLEELLDVWASTPARRWLLLLHRPVAAGKTSSPMLRRRVRDLVDTAWYHAVALDPHGAATLDAEALRRALVAHILEQWPIPGRRR